MDTLPVEVVEDDRLPAGYMLLGPRGMDLAALLAGAMNGDPRVMVLRVSGVET